MSAILAGLLNFILLILKILGIVLLLIIAILLIILFSKINVKAMIDNKNNLKYFIKITYILGLFSYVLDSENNIKCFKIFGINIEKYKKLKMKKKTKKQKVKSKNNIKKEEPKKICKDDEVDKNNENIKINGQINQNDEKILSIDINLKDVKTDDKKIDSKGLYDDDKQSQKDYSEKFNVKKIFYYSKYIQSYPDKKEIINLSFLLLKRLLKSIKISKIKLDIEYGLDEPYKTGNLCGIISMSIPFLHKKISKNIKIMPNFQEEMFLINCDLKCKTSLFKILLPIIKFIVKEPIRKIIFKKENDYVKS